MNVTMGIMCLCFLFTSTLLYSDASAYRNLEVDKLLARLNKPPVKSIHVPYGDIIDCIPIYNQPAFDHPLLRDHTIQMSPSNYPKGMDEVEIGEEPVQDWHEYGSCPDGTVPILRTKSEDVLRASSVESYGKKSPSSVIPGLIQPNQMGAIDEYALAISENGVFQGGSGTFSVWNPFVEGRREHSSGQMWIIGRGADQAEALEAGMHVYPWLYGDNRTRFFIHWTKDSYQTTGCYNLKCSGFVHTSNRIALGARLYPISSYNVKDYIMKLNIWKEQGTNNYWLKFQNEAVGYWPSKLFVTLPIVATNVNFGGEVTNYDDGIHTSTQMGSGHFPEEGYKKSAYISELSVVNKDFIVEPFSDFEIRIFNSNCYRLKSGYSNGLKSHIYYGGPGRNPNCL